jgi:hypothetical protein
MARKSILNNYYIFDPANRVVVIPGGITREKLVLITNVTDNKVIYNFSDPELTASAYSIATDIRNVTTTRVTLTYDTTSMSATDKLQIVYDDFDESFTPSEAYHDAVNKLRISQPQSQMDTDFEYGTQSTKWEGLATINNNPFAYKGDTPYAVTDIQVTTNSKVVTVSINTLVTALPAAGAAIFVQDTDFPGANGVFIVDTVTPAQSRFTYTASFPWTAGNGGIWDGSRTAIYAGVHYTGSDIGGTITLAAGTGTMAGSVQVDCTNVHGLEVGNEIAVTGSSGTNVNGSWVVARVESPTRFYYFPDLAPSGSINSGTKKLYPRPQGNSIHRAFDGGVKFSTNTFSANQSAVRQTKRYFRYQSGKGVAFSTGSILAPAIENIDSITASGNTVTVVCAVAHNLTRDTIVDVRGVNDNNYNGQFQVSNVIDPYSFQYIATSTPQEAIAAGNYTISPINSYGTKLEIGMMDQQNGIFFRYANGHLGVVRRSSTFQLSGKVTVTSGSSLVSSYTTPNGQGTKFGRQLTPGDYIVIRGTSYRVDGVISDTQIVIFPDYRGPSASNVPVSKTTEVEWKQAEWNIDRCDGTGKSGYDLDLTKMQMFYMDYSWYGAGFIRWGFRATDGNVLYAHKIPNNNFNTEAYMRSGNLPARYEVNTIPPFVSSTKSISTGDTTIFVNRAPYSFPTSGTLKIKQSTGSTTGVIEYVNYTGKTEFRQDIISANASGNVLTVASTTGLAPGGTQTIVFDRPFSNIVAEKTYYVASVPSSTTFTITTVAGSSTPASITTATGSALSPLAVAESGSFTGVTREQAGATGRSLTISSGSSTGTVNSGTGIQKGQVVVGPNIPDDTFVHSISGTNIVLSKAVTAANPTNVTFSTLGSGAAQTFTYSATRPIAIELLRATSVPTISHWGSSVIMEGRYDDDRSYVYTVGSRSQRAISVGASIGIVALRVSPSVDNSLIGNFGTRELVNRMQLVLRAIDTSSTGKFFIEVLLNPIPSSNNNWVNVGGTSLAQYSILSIGTTLTGGEVIYGFYADNGVNSYDLSIVKEISNSILGGGGTSYANSTSPNPTGIFPDGPEVIVIRATNIDTTSRNIDARISWTEAQA